MPASETPAVAAPQLAPVAVKSATAQVAERIIDAITSGQFGKGERLPAERELARQLQVSRPTLREALAALELAGLVRTDQGRGTTVISTTPPRAEREVLPAEVFEARLAVEPELAALAARKQFPEDLAHLQQVAAGVFAEFERTGAYASDLPVHRAVAAAARNPILSSALEAALQYTESDHWADLRRRALGPSAARRGHVDEIAELVAGITAGDGSRAAEIWRHHLETYRDEMLKGLHDAGE